MGWKVGRLLEMSITTPAASDHQIWMDDVQCSQSETHIEQCTHADSGKWQWGTLTNCTHANDIGVGCDQFDGASTSAGYPGIRVIKSGEVISLTRNNSFAKEGRVEIRKNGIWGTVCNDQSNEDK